MASAKDTSTSTATPPPGPVPVSLLAGSRFQLLPVAGAYFQLADYAQISDEDDHAFCRRLIVEHGVAAIPVSAFYESPPAQRLVRFCFAKTTATLDAAAEKLCAI